MIGQIGLRELVVATAGTTVLVVTTLVSRASAADACFTLVFEDCISPRSCECAIVPSGTLIEPLPTFQCKSDPTGQAKQCDKTSAPEQLCYTAFPCMLTDEECAEPLKVKQVANRAHPTTGPGKDHRLTGGPCDPA
jgi:hypothetical protein